MIASGGSADTSDQIYRPRRFSEAYLSEEREKLKAYREVFREIIKQMQLKNFL